MVTSYLEETTVQNLAKILLTQKRITKPELSVCGGRERKEEKGGDLGLWIYYDLLMCQMITVSGDLWDQRFEQKVLEGKNFGIKFMSHIIIFLLIHKHIQ